MVPRVEPVAKKILRGVGTGSAGQAPPNAWVSASSRTSTDTAARFMLRLLRRLGLELGRHGDLQHLEVVGVVDLLVLDAGRLVDGRAGDQPVLAIALVVEDRPALQHVDELELERVGVAWR